jgi:catechol 2,3-dioxygenase-like lactoylglutathione lyase family enzyme
MSIGITGFDHPIIAVRDLEQSRILYQQLGFTVPPAGRHLEWGTGNWCIMFGRNYLEHRGIADPARYTHGLEVFLAEREGLLGSAFRSDLDNRDVYRNAIDAGLHPAEPRELTRNFLLESGTVPVSFRLVFFNAAQAPAMMSSLVCEHLTPDRLRKPEFLTHANGALNVFEMTSVVASLTGVREQLLPYFGGDAIREVADEITVAMQDGEVLRIVSRQKAEDGGLAIPGVQGPYLSSVGIHVSDLARTRGVLDQNEIPFDVLSDRIRVQPPHTCGYHLDFVEA